MANNNDTNNDTNKSYCPKKIEALIDEGVLGLGWVGMTADDVQRIAQMECLEGVRELALAFYEHQNRGVRAVVSSAYLRKLEVLDFSGIGITEEGVCAILETENLPALKELDLSGNTLGDSFMKVSFANLEALERLSLHNSDICPGGLRSIAESVHLSRLRVLDFRYNLEIYFSEIEFLKESKVLKGCLVMGGGKSESSQYRFLVGSEE